MASSYNGRRKYIFVVCSYISTTSKKCWKKYSVLKIHLTFHCMNFKACSDLKHFENSLSSASNFQKKNSFFKFKNTTCGKIRIENDVHICYFFQVVNRRNEVQLWKYYLIYYLDGHLYWLVLVEYMWNFVVCPWSDQILNNWTGKMTSIMKCKGAQITKDLTCCDIMIFLQNN